MSQTAKLIVAAAAAALIGSLLTLLASRAGHPTAGDVLPAGGHDRTHALSYCVSAPGGPDFYREIDAANERMHRDMAIQPSGDPDRDFARMMIPHHQGAIDMALVQLKYGRDVRLKRLAQAILVEQTQEILYMRTLLDAPPSATADPSTH